MNHIRAVKPIDPSTQLGEHPPQKIFAHPPVIPALLQQVKQLPSRHLFEDQAIEVFGRE